MTRKVDGKTYALKKVDVSSLDDKELVSALNEVRACVHARGLLYQDMRLVEKRGPCPTPPPVRFPCFLTPLPLLLVLTPPCLVPCCCRR